MRSSFGLLRAVSLGCLLSLFVAGRGFADSSQHYRAPDLKTPIFGGALSFDPAQRKAAATALAELVSESLDLSSEDGNRNATRLLGIALRLDPRNRQAVIVNGYLRDDQPPEHHSDWKQDDAIAALHHAADTAKAANTAPDNEAAAYLYASLLLVRADDDDRFELETLRSSGSTISWDWADQSTGLSDAAGARGGSSYHLPAHIKPADRAAIQQALRDSTTVKSLVVVSAADGPPHGKTLDIIAVAPKDEDVVFPRIRAETMIGSEMRISLEEAVRLARLRDARAGVDQMRVAVIPASNLQQLREALLLEGPSLVWDTQVAGADTLDDAIALMRKDRAPEMEEAMTLFESLRSKMEDRSIDELKNNADARNTLAKILQLMPNNLSAAMLKELAAGKGVQRLSLTGSLEQIAFAMGPLGQSVQRGGYVSDPGGVHQTVEKLRKVHPILDPGASGVYSAVLEYCDAIDELSSAKRDTFNFARQSESEQRCREKAAAVRDAFRKVVDDQGDVDKLLRGE